MLYLGVDLGTSSMKVLLVDSSGKVLGSTSQSYPLMMPQPGWSEQDPEQWWSALCVCVPKLLEGVDASQVAGLSVGGQMHGLVALDENDQVIRPAILWNDGRTSTQTDAINNDFGMQKLLELTGNLAFAGFTAPKLLWMRENEPELFAKIRRIMLPKDYIVYRLTGVHCCDYSDASGMLLLDVANRCWSKPLMDYCGVKEEQLGKLFESYENVGTVKPEMSELLGIPATAVVAAGAGDNAAAAVGTGTVGEGSCNISIGTSGTIFIPSKEFKVPSEGNLHAFAHSDGTYHLMGCILAAASAYTWWRRDILKGTSDNEEQQDITLEKLGNNHVYYLPYLMGERSPHNDPFARGAFAGMSLDTTRSDMTQAVMEGVAFAIRDSVEIVRSLGIDINASNLCGGGAKSPIWRQIFANVLKMELTVPDSEEGAGYGAAILAMVAAGEYANVLEACAAMPSGGTKYTPDPEIMARYDERYAQFKAIYPALKPIFPKM
ncbi:MAG: xylulokinase [Ruminococcaceae bacterium]|nr:xylulokinase [Oscillospiraceae bacterium]